MRHWWRQHLRQLPPTAVELDALDESGQAGILALVVDHSPDPAAVVELRDLVSRTLTSASPEDRMSFVLRDQGWSPAEITHVLGIYGQLLSPPAAVIGAANAVQAGAKILEELSAAPSVFEQHQELRSMLVGYPGRVRSARSWGRHWGSGYSISPSAGRSGVAVVS